MMKFRRVGFTLVELLIVVGIITILAAIAVPNLLEAQTRAKVSRVKNDMRTVVLALESYRVDNNQYPLCANLDGSPIHPYPSGGPYIMGTRLGVGVTTPIAYLTTRPNDIFSENPRDLMPFYYHTLDYSIALKGLFGYWYFEDYIYCLLDRPRAFTAYVLVSNGPDLDHDLLSRPET